MICIYKITNVKNGKFYIGSTKNFKKRKARHLRELKNEEHHCIYLQRAFNIDKIDSFAFSVLEICLKDELFDKERYWIDLLHPEYNIGGVCGGDNYTNHPNKEEMRVRLGDQLRKCKRVRLFKEDNSNWRGGKTFFTCPTCKNEIRIAGSVVPKTCNKCRNRDGSNNPFFNKKHSDETKAKIKAIKLSQKSCFAKKCSIDGIIYDSISEAARQLKIDKCKVIYRLKSKLNKHNSWFILN